MKQKIILVLAALLIPLYQVASQVPIADLDICPDIHTATLEVDGQPLSLPVLGMESEGQLLLEFDLLADQPASLVYSFHHCDAHWMPDDLEPTEFYSGFNSAPIDDFAFSFNTLVPYVHYTLRFPDSYSHFTHSGNYVLRVGLADQPDSVLLVRRFYVTEQVANIETQVVRPYDGHDIHARQEVDAMIWSRNLRLDHQYLTLVAYQNRRTDNWRDLQFSGYDRDRLCYRNRPCNIFEGGNTFRFFDCSNLHAKAYNVAGVETYGGETFVMLRPLENRANKHYSAEVVLPGGMKANIVDRSNPTLEADYVWVNFSLPQKTPYIDGSLHIVGDLTGWQLDSTSRMDYNPQYHAYTKRLLLKQGYYAYQVLFLPSRKGSAASTDRVEGNHYQTPNRYTLFLYQHAPSDRADRLLSIGTAQP